MSGEDKGAVRKFWDWLKDLSTKEDPRRSTRTPNNTPTVPANQGPNQEQRYRVENQHGEEVATSATLTEAHQQWQQLTKQLGRIVDLATGQDVTPEPDDNGRFLVI